jgi:hypothetical protein
MFAVATTFIIVFDFVLIIIILAVTSIRVVFIINDSLFFSPLAYIESLL